MNKLKALFLCTGNSARSQMGEALLRRYAGNTFEVHSAGLEPKGLNPYTVRVMEELGIDLSRHYSKSVKEYLGHVNFSYLITVCSDAEEKCPTTFLGISHRLHWPFEDPAQFEGADDEKLARFREVRDQIDERLRAWLRDLNIPIEGNNAVQASPA